MLTIDFADPATNADPFPIFERLREADPVHWSEPMKAWVLTRYEDVKAIALNNAEISANRLEPWRTIVSAALYRNERLGYPRVTMSGTSQRAVTSKRTPARASFSSHTST